MLMVYDKITYKALRLLNISQNIQREKLDMAMITFAKASIYFNTDAQRLFSSPSLCYHLKNPSHKTAKVKIKKDSSLQR